MIEIVLWIAALVAVFTAPRVVILSTSDALVSVAAYIALGLGLFGWAALASIRLAEVL